MERNLAEFRNIVQSARNADARAAEEATAAADEQRAECDRAYALVDEIRQQLDEYVAMSEGLLRHERSAYSTPDTDRFLVYWRPDAPAPEGRHVEIIVIPSDGVVYCEWGIGRDTKRGRHHAATEFDLMAVIRLLSDDRKWGNGLIPTD